MSLGDDSIKDAPTYEQPSDPDDYVETDDTEVDPTTREEYTKDPDATTEDPDEDPYDPGDWDDTETTENTEDPAYDYDWGDDDTDDESDMVEVPDVVGMSYRDAAASLTSAGLDVGNIEFRSHYGSSDDEVLDQVISAGSKIERGSKIDLYICDNETITKYRYRDIVDYDITSSDSNSAPAGYKYYKTDTSYSYDGWGGWSEWGPNYIAGSDTCNVESQSGAVFGIYVDGNRGAHDKNVGGCTRNEYYRPWSWVTTMTEHDGTAFQWPGSTTERYWIPDNGMYVCRNVMGSGEWTWSGTVYRYQTRQKIENKTYWYRKPIWGSWSGWSEDVVYSSDTREVESDTQYKYSQY